MRDGMRGEGGRGITTCTATALLGELAQREEVAVHPVARERVARDARVVGGGFAHQRHLLRRRRLCTLLRATSTTVAEGGGEGVRLGRRRADRLGAAVLEGGRRRRLVRGGREAVHPVVCELEGHLQHPVGRRAVLLEQRRGEDVALEHLPLHIGQGRGVSTQWKPDGNKPHMRPVCVRVCVEAATSVAVAMYGAGVATTGAAL